jgi:hypothetical protein
MTLTLDSCMLTVLYAYGLLSYLTARGLRPRPDPENDWEPVVSVIVTAENDAGLTVRCMESFSRLDYPADKLEFIRADGRSGDVSGRWKKGSPRSGRRVRLIDTAGMTEGKNGKSDGLEAACRSASGEVLFFTRGDCEVHAEWIRTLLKLYAPDVGMAAGFVTADSRDRLTRLSARIQSLDRILLGAIGSAWSNLGFPGGASGKNFSMRKSAFVRTGGRAQAGRKGSEDFPSFRGVMDRTRWRTVWTDEETGAVRSEPSSSIAAYCRQRAIPAGGGENRGVLAMSLSTVEFIARLSVVVSAAAGAWKLALLGFWSLLLMDGLVLSQPLFALGRADLFGNFFAYETFNIGCSIFFAPLAFLGGKLSRMRRAMTKTIP